MIGLRSYHRSRGEPLFMESTSRFEDSFGLNGLWMEGDESSKRSFCSIEQIAFITLRSFISSTAPLSPSTPPAMNAENYTYRKWSTHDSCRYDFAFSWVIHPARKHNLLHRRQRLYIKPHSQFTPFGSSNEQNSQRYVSIFFACSSLIPTLRYESHTQGYHSQ